MVKLSLPGFSPDSRKGEKGRVMVIGGSEAYYGAPILTALGAQASGADLIRLCLPLAYVPIACNYGLNFFLQPFKKNHLTPYDVHGIVSAYEHTDVVIIGNGLGKHIDTRKSVCTLLQTLQGLPIVLDAEALFPEILSVREKFSSLMTPWIITPHHGEFLHLFGQPFSKDFSRKCAEKYQLIILLKGPIDYIITPDALFENHTGCAQMRVGGTGDVLAGLVGGYCAQDKSDLSTLVQAVVYYYGEAGAKLGTTRRCFTAEELAREYPHLTE